MNGPRYLSNRILPVVGVLVILAVAISCSNKSTNPQNPVEEVRYPAIKEILTDAIPQFCQSLHDALRAEYETDTALIPGLVWPVNLPAHRRNRENNYADSTTSWFVIYSPVIANGQIGYQWNLGRYDTAGTIPHLSPRVASRVEHRLTYNYAVGTGDTALVWIVTLHVTLTDLDKDTALVTATLHATYRAGQTCDGLCDDFTVTLSNGRLTKVGGLFDVATLTDDITADLKRTEPGAIIGITAHFEWAVNGTIASPGHVSLRVTSGKFDRAEDYSLCP
jgi:hypothetical protein